MHIQNKRNNKSMAINNNDHNNKNNKTIHSN